MVWTQISLSQEQYERLEALARTSHRTMTALLRDAVDELLRDAEREERWETATAAIGAFSSGRHDVAVDHDEAFDT